MVHNGTQYSCHKVETNIEFVWLARNLLILFQSSHKKAFNICIGNNTVTYIMRLTHCVIKITCAHYMHALLTETSVLYTIR